MIGIIALMAGVIMTYSLRDGRLAMVEAEQRSVGNVLEMAELAIHTQYLQLLSEKVGTIQNRKNAFREFGGVVLETLEMLATQGHRGDADDAAARETAVHWLAQLSPISGEYVFAFDRDGRAVAYPNRTLLAQEISTFYDIRGRPLTEGVWSDSLLYGSTFLTYGRKLPGGETSEQKYGYFVPYPRWGWMIAIVGDIADLRRDTDLRRAKLVDRLRSSLGSLRMAGNGFVFVFSGEGHLVVPPKSEEARWLTPAVLAELRAMVPDRRAQAHLAPLVVSGDQPMEAQVFRLKALDWYVAAIVSTSALAQPAQKLIFNQGIVFTIGILLAVVLAWYLAQRLSRPLVTLTQRAHRLSQTDFTRPPNAAEAFRASGADEIGRLSEAFSFMERALYSNVQTVMRVTQERERIEGELNVARDIQLGLLPKIFPAFPHRTEIDIYATLISAKEVGGDLYDFYFVDDRHLCFTIGDVAGKGVPAALFMAITKTLIKSAADRFTDPALMMAAVNGSLANDNPNSIFVTSLIGILDCHTGAIQYTNGGHNPPMIVRQDGRADVLRPVSGPVLGIMEDVDYEIFEAKLAPNETLLLYTDGVTEAMNDKNELYEERRLITVLESQSCSMSAEKIVRQIMSDIQGHVRDTPQSDDITLVALRFIPSA